MGGWQGDKLGRAGHPRPRSEDKWFILCQWRMGKEIIGGPLDRICSTSQTINSEGQFVPEEQAPCSVFPSAGCILHFPSPCNTSLCCGPEKCKPRLAISPTPWRSPSQPICFRAVRDLAESSCEGNSYHWSQFQGLLYKLSSSAGVPCAPW